SGPASCAAPSCTTCATASARRPASASAPPSPPRRRKNRPRPSKDKGTGGQGEKTRGDFLSPGPLVPLSPGPLVWNGAHHVHFRQTLVAALVRHPGRA